MVKKVVNVEDIDELKIKSERKIFDVLRIENKTFFLDRDFNLIWDSDAELAGVINNNKYIFFDDITKNNAIHSN